ncbi:hypothetical protein NEF87_001316 [Candidatus Lokiarchaeum ossiferum]|uniref:Uncharacterized protein n=1 Tax=Candidatus Lokiarchaeum ossiferum TaxID=2951803 RepID=A0ABY6HR43_9ARCH|nr:hypothetical protein NEF87_001316 [Candidatus Lokiarchaeum sp. B-35]
MFNRCRKMREWINISEVESDPECHISREIPFQEKITKNTLKKNEENILDQWFVQLMKEYNPYFAQTRPKTTSQN